MTFYFLEDPDHKGCQRDKGYYEMKLKDIPVALREKKLKKENNTQEKMKYEALCRGDKLLVSIIIILTRRDRD